MNLILIFVKIIVNEGCFLISYVDKKVSSGKKYNGNLIYL